MKLKVKNLRPLQLTKETLQGLETPTMNFAQGGASYYTGCYTGCNSQTISFDCCFHH